MNAPIDSQAATFEQAVCFIWLEADLLDRRAYREWLALWMSDARYVVPSQHDVEDFEDSLNYIYDDASMRGRRVDRLLGGRTISERPPTRTVRTLSRFRMLESVPGELMIESAMIIVAARRRSQSIIAANVTHRLMRSEGNLRIAGKIVRLVDLDETIPNIGFIL